MAKGLIDGITAIEEGELGQTLHSEGWNKTKEEREQLTRVSCTPSQSKLQEAKKKEVYFSLVWQQSGQNTWGIYRYFLLVALL